jgi:hypothetical protein
MARALRMPQGSLRAHVTCLAAVLGFAPALPQVQALAVEGLAAALGRVPLHEDPSPGDLAEAEAFMGSEMGENAGAAGDGIVDAARGVA